MNIVEITANEAELYKNFFRAGLVNDENNFRITLTDDENITFPTTGTADSFTLGAFIDNTLAGVVSFARDGIDRQKIRHKGTLFRMYVDQKYRGKGIANQLIHEVLDKAIKLNDIEQINLTVVAHNKTAKALYERFGFKTFASEENAIKWKGNYFTEEQMALKL